jgi:putative lipoic acid-binding regulatory protein
LKTIAPLLLPFALFGLAQSGLQAAPESVPQTEARCFQTQFLLRLMGLEAQQFVQQVAALQELAPDDPAIPARVHTLRGQAVALRVEEAKNFTQVSILFQTMGATPKLRVWAATETGLLKAPVLMTQDEQTTATTDPDTAEVLATLDECDRVKADTDDHISTLGNWISLTAHSAGLWAADVGELSAALQIGIMRHTPPRLEATLGRRLAATAPQNTPSSVINALKILSSARGNLSDLAPATDADIPLTQASSSDSALMSAFSAVH